MKKTSEPPKLAMYPTELPPIQYFPETTQHTCVIADPGLPTIGTIGYLPNRSMLKQPLEDLELDKRDLERKMQNADLYTMQQRQKFNEALLAIPQRKEAYLTENRINLLLDSVSKHKNVPPSKIILGEEKNKISFNLGAYAARLKLLDSDAEPVLLMRAYDPVQGIMSPFVVAQNERSEIKIPYKINRREKLGLVLDDVLIFLMSYSALQYFILKDPLAKAKVEVTIGPIAVDIEGKPYVRIPENELVAIEQLK